MTLPGQTISILDPGLGLVDAADTTPVYLGTSSLGAPSTLASYSNKKAVTDALGQGPLTEALCENLDIAGGPALGIRLAASVAGSLGSVSTVRTTSSTGTLTPSVTPVTATKAWQIDDPAGTPIFVDETADLASAATADVDPWPATEAAGDQLAMGYQAPFNSVTFTVSTNGVGGTVAVKYWNGTAWTAVSGLSDGTTGLTGSGTVTFTMPTDWVARTLNSTDSLFYLVVEVATVYSTNPVISQATIGNQGPHDKYEVDVEVLVTGTLGAGAFRYSLDDQRSWSEQLTIPSGGVYDVPNTGMRLTFAAGGGPVYFEDGDLFSFDTVAPHYGVADVAAAFTALRDTSTPFDFVVLTGKHASTSDGATMFASVATQMASLATNFKFARVLMDAGNSVAATAITDYASSSNARVGVVYGDEDRASSKPFAGYGSPKMPFVNSVGARAAAVLPSTDLGRVPDGSVVGSLEISHDERLATTPLDVAKFTTGRTFVDRAGIYITHGRLMSPAGSDFKYWQHGRVMDLACKTAHAAQQNFINTSVRTNADGSIDERDAARIEGVVTDALTSALADPVNAEGTKGHVSDFRYSIDRTNNVQTTDTILASVAIRPLGYVKFITTTIGFTANVGN